LIQFTSHVLPPSLEILTKVGVRDRTRAVLKALELGYV
jgi:hypothetical protein